MTFKEPGNNEDIMDEQTLDLSEVLMTTFQTFKISGGERHKKAYYSFPNPSRFAKKKRKICNLTDYRILYS